MVTAPLAMIRRPVAVEPVNATVSTIGFDVSSSPRSPCPLITFKRPGGTAGHLGGLGDEEGVEWCPGVRLEHHGASGGQGRRDVHTLSLNGKLNGVMAATTPTGFRTTAARRSRWPRRSVAGMTGPEQRSPLEGARSCHGASLEVRAALSDLSRTIVAKGIRRERVTGIEPA